MIQTTCPSCSKNLKLADNLQGKQIRCPACKHVFRVAAPAADEAVVEEPAPAKPRPAPKPAAKPVAKPAARPAPPPPAEEEDPFAMTEEPAPVAAKGRPKPPPPPQDDEDPFAMTAEPPARPAARRKAAPPPPPEDESESDSEGVAAAGDELRQARKVARRGGGALFSAFVFELIPYVCFIVTFFALGGGQGGRGAELNIAMIAVFSVLYLIPVIFVAIGSSMLSGVRGRGMVITACIMAFIAGLQLLIYGGFWGLAVVGLLNLGAPMSVLTVPILVAATSLLGLVMSLVGGIRGLITLGKPQVQAAYRR